MSNLKTSNLNMMEEFRNGEIASKLVNKINTLSTKLPSKIKKPLKFMEVCGGHTHAIFRYGIKDMLPDIIDLVHGPGCPVCVLPMSQVDACVKIAESPNVIFTTFGDAMRVPGSNKSLLQAKAQGADIRMVYSPLDSLKLAFKNPDKEVVFFGLGFETTMPTTALTLLQAHKESLTNFKLFCNHITIIPTIKAILDSPDLRLDGFIGPGHVSMVIGIKPYKFIANEYKKPLVIAGFEPLDVLQSLYMLLKQKVECRSEIENQYKRVVLEEGNKVSLDAIKEVFEIREFFEWRGLGYIDYSGVRIREKYALYDAEKHFSISMPKTKDPELCECGAVLKGVLKPWECKIFGKECTPENPLGALMTSSEGACAAYYNFGRMRKDAS